MRQASARDVALETLLQIEQQQTYSNLALQAAFRKHALSGQDRHLVTQLVYGTVQYQLLIDHQLAPFLKQPVMKLKPWMRMLLRLSVYQLLFLTKVPAFAVINEAVEMTGRRASTLKGFVNAVLRNVKRAYPEGQKLVISEDEIPNTIQDISIQTSHPQWMIESFAKDYGVKEAFQIAVSNNVSPYMTLRVNTMKISLEEVLEQCAAEGKMAIPSPVSPYGIRLMEGLDIANWEPFRAGFVTVQDESAMLVAPLLSPERGERILDACAAPGGKTTHLAELVEDEAEIWATDLHPHKISLIRGAANRLGLHSIHEKVHDIQNAIEFSEPFDRILLDAPCSGLGVLRRKPDLKWRKTPEEVAGLQGLQLRMLRTVWDKLKVGGVLVYSTCTLRYEENESVIKSFLQECQDAQSEDVAAFLPDAVVDRALFAPEGVTILPSHFSSDGFFFSRLRKMEV